MTFSILCCLTIYYFAVQVPQPECSDVLDPSPPGYSRYDFRPRAWRTWGVMVEPPMVTPPELADVSGLNSNSSASFEDFDGSDGSACPLPPHLLAVAVPLLEEDEERETEL